MLVVFDLRAFEGCAGRRLVVGNEPNRPGVAMRGPTDDDVHAATAIASHSRASSPGWLSNSTVNALMSSSNSRPVRLGRLRSNVLDEMSAENDYRKITGP